MELVRKVAEFTTPVEENREIYKMYIRSILEQSSVVWHSSLSSENAEDLERVQKAAVRLILGNKYENYEDGLIKANLDSLNVRRDVLCKKFAIKCIKSDNPRVKNMFPQKENKHAMAFRKNENW